MEYAIKKCAMLRVNKEFNTILKRNDGDKYLDTLKGDIMKQKKRKEKVNKEYFRRNYQKQNSAAKEYLHFYCEIFYVLL